MRKVSESCPFCLPPDCSWLECEECFSSDFMVYDECRKSETLLRILFEMGRNFGALRKKSSVGRQALGIATRVSTKLHQSIFLTVQR